MPWQHAPSHATPALPDTSQNSCTNAANETKNEENEQKVSAANTILAHNDRSMLRIMSGVDVCSCPALAVLVCACTRMRLHAVFIYRRTEIQLENCSLNNSNWCSQSWHSQSPSERQSQSQSQSVAATECVVKKGKKVVNDNDVNDLKTDVLQHVLAPSLSLALSFCSIFGFSSLGNHADWARHCGRNRNRPEQSRAGSFPTGQQPSTDPFSCNLLSVHLNCHAVGNAENGSA